MSAGDEKPEPEEKIVPLTGRVPSFVQMAKRCSRALFGVRYPRFPSCASSIPGSEEGNQSHKRQYQALCP